MQRIRVWDWPTRLFHWSLVLLVTGAFYTGLRGGNWMAWHGRLGLAMLALVAFRLAWGLLGSTYARFAQFVPGPARLHAYLTGRWQGLGHNPLGALSILAMLAVLAVQAGSGLFANDDIAFSGPLRRLIDSTTSSGLTGWHRRGVWVIGGLVVLHVGAVLFHAVARGENLLRPMLTGWKQVADPPARPVTGGGPLALAVALAFAGLVWWLASGAWLPPPAPLAPAPW